MLICWLEMLRQNVIFTVRNDKLFYRIGKHMFCHMKFIFVSYGLNLFFLLYVINIICGWKNIL